ncbi:hypothetical protein ACFQT0_21540 [Hymenobacter humi]|uniref:Uncharacterized protein n=1 Tax=Hymenobacter humi TaxID=1411620 RepID=A0ABW2U9Z2_9BACT
MFFLLASSASFAQTEGKRPNLKSKHYYTHTSESSKGKNAKVKFRKVNNIRPTIDLNPKSQEKFKTAKAPKNWKWSKGF